MSAITEAVMFFQDGDIIKEMYLPEFEAVLDNVVGISDFANRELQAVFLQISPQLKVLGTVFFLISFDDEGRVTGNWNIPLRHLLDHATLGPDLGAGSIRVACRSACPVEWHSRQLWDPDMDGQQSFRRLSAAVERNKLGILAEVGHSPARTLKAGPFFNREKMPGLEAAEQAEQPLFNRKYRQKIQSLLNEHRLELATQQQEFRAAQEKLENRFARQLAERDAGLDELQRALDETEKLRRHSDALAKKQRLMLEEKAAEFESQLDQGGKDYQLQLETLRAQYAHEMQERLNEIIFSSEETIRKREEELYERATEIVELRAELSEVKASNRSLMLNTDEHVLDEMVKKGVVFVAYHPGIEHLIIAKDEMPQYLGDPVAFAAARCEVSEQHYKEWLVHYRLPICRALEEGHYCGQPVKKVMRPLLFRNGESDRCREHQLPLE